MLMDKYAKRIAIERFALPPCLHIPIAARSYSDLETYVGTIENEIAPGTPPKALLLEVPFSTAVDPALPIWALSESQILRKTRQLWVHVDYRGYRKAYSRAFPDENIEGRAIDHVLNREAARLKDFTYVRLAAISVAANSSSGGLSEKWAIDYYRSPEMIEKSRASPARIQYADLADIVKMLDRKTGGALQDPVNEAQVLVKART